MAGKRSFRPLTAEERKARQDESVAIMRAAVAKLQESESFKAALRFHRRLHKYSFANALLIFGQRRDATYVAGFERWKELGRSVRAGEKAIKIWVPMTTKAKGDDGGPVDVGPNVGAELEPTTRTFFKLGNVFDVSQTDGPPVPEYPSPEPLTADDPRTPELIAALVAVALEEVGAPVTFDPPVGSAKGFYDPTNHRISVSNAEAPLQQAKTLAHELAHAKVHRRGAGEESETRRAIQELEAEATAYLVFEELGLDSSQYTFPYLAGWAEQPDALLPACQTACRVAGEIVDHVHVRLGVVRPDVDEMVRVVQPPSAVMMAPVGDGDELYQWARNTRKHQALGNRHRLSRLDEALFATFVRDEHVDEAGAPRWPTLAEFQAAHPDHTHLSLVQYPNRPEPYVRGTGPIDVLRPIATGDPRWLLRVTAFDSPEAIAQSELDGSVFDPQEPARGRRPPRRTRVTATTAGAGSTRGSSAHVSPRPLTA